jgi:hypothetical protein
LSEPFEYTDDPRSWIPYYRSPVDLTAFNLQLAERFGLNRFGEPNVRCVWGGGERERKPDGRYGLKYFRVFTKPVKRLDQHSKLLVVREEREELGNPRFIIERFTPPEKLAPPEWLRFPRGRYVFYYEVETERGKYRPVGDDTIGHISECLAGEAEFEKQITLDLQRLADEEERDLERNAKGENLPYNPGQPRVFAPR